MSSFRAVLFTLLISLGLLGPATAQQHWMQGKWMGSVTNLPTTNRFGPDRTLEVGSVSADGGSARGIWTSSAGKVNVSISIAGDSVTFTTPGSSGANYKLTRKGGTLEGSWTPTGGASAGGSVTLKKQ